MPEKGKTNNPNGRPPGVPNRVTSTLRPLLTTWLSDNFKSVTDKIKTLDDKDQVNAYCTLLKFALPQLTNASISFEELTNEQIDMIIDSMSETKLDKLIERIQKLRQNG